MLMLQGTPNLKPLRDYSENEVINGMFSCQVVPTNKGTVVTIATNSGSPNVMVTGTGGVAPVPFQSQAATPYGLAPSYVTTDFWGIWGNQVRAANSGDVPLGVTVVDCAEYNKYGESYAARPKKERDAQQVVLSGESVKIVTRGKLKVNAIVGTPSGNAGAYASGGYFVVCPYRKDLFPNLLGKFLTPKDADGYAYFKLEL